MTEHLTKHMDKVSDMLLTVEQLICSGALASHKNKVCGQLIVETVYDDEASMVVIEHGKRGEVFPLHCHKGCVQFLICVKGRFSVHVPSDDIIRILKPNACFVVEESKMHSVHCLEDNSKLVGVVIPPDPSYRTK